MPTPAKHDVLASNLLFACLLLSVLGVAIPWLADWFSPHGGDLPVSDAVAGQHALRLLGPLLLLGLRAGLYYAIRRGLRWAKWLVVLFSSAAAYFTTYWRGRYVAGVNLHELSGYFLLSLVENLLILAALVLMFWPARRPLPAQGVE